MVSEEIKIVYGIHSVRHALASAGNDVLELWIQEGKKSTKPVVELLAMASRQQLSVQWVTRKVLDKLAQQGNHQGVAIRRRMGDSLQVTMESLLAADDLPSALFLVLDGIQDVHNLGACLRTADAAGVRAVILPKNRAAGVDEVVCKVASGAVEHIPIIEVVNVARCLRQMRQAGVWIIGTDAVAEKTIYEMKASLPLVLVVGSESRGLRQNIRQHCDQLVAIPMWGIVESLNVSVATGVCLYEMQRQCR